MISRAKEFSNPLIALAFGLAVLGVLYIWIAYGWTKAISSCPGDEAGTALSITMVASILPACLFGASIWASQAGHTLVAATLCVLGSVAAFVVLIAALYHWTNIGLSCSTAWVPTLAFPLGALTFFGVGWVGLGASFRLVRDRERA